MIGVDRSVLVKYHLSPANFRRLLSFGHLICVVLRELDYGTQDFVWKENKLARTASSAPGTAMFRGILPSVEVAQSTPEVVAAQICDGGGEVVSERFVTPEQDITDEYVETSGPFL